MAQHLSHPAGAGGGQAGAYGSAQGVRDLLGGLWASVAIAAPTAAEQLAILGRAFPQLSALLPAGLAALSLVKTAAGQSWDEAIVSRKFTQTVQQLLHSLKVNPSNLK